MGSPFAQRFCIVSSIWIALSLNVALQPSTIAQVIPDGTLSTTVTTTDNRNFVIENGDRAGPNLFHSFDDFSIPNNGSAVFNHSVDIDLILNRVTGNQVSRINGHLQSNGTADIFLLNPNGIVFGPNATLDVGGSFIGTTANTLLFEDGGQFDAIANSPLLSISTPIGLQLSASSASITGRGNEPSRLSRSDDFLLQPLSRDLDRVHLQAAPGHTLAFLGNGLSFSGSNLVADNGHIALGSVASGIVGLIQTDNIWRFSYDQVGQFSNIRLRSQSALDASGFESQGLQLVGRNISLTDGSLAFIQSLGNADQADIEVIASGQLYLARTDPSVTTTSGIRNELINLGAAAETVSDGEILILASDLVIEDGAEIVLPNYSTQTSGSIHLDVDDVIRVDGSSPLGFSRVAIANFSAGNAGDVNLNGTQLLLTDGGTIASVTSGTGNGGNVNLAIAESIDITGLGSTLSGELIASGTIDASTVGIGDAGSVTIRTRSIFLDNGNITSTTLASGNAGSIDIEAESIEMITSEAEFRSEITSAARDNTAIQGLLELPSPTGNAGSLSIRSSHLHLLQNALVAVENQGPGDAGDINIAADVILLQKGSGISAETLAGDGGNLNVFTDHLLALQNASLLSAAAGDAGNGGNINVASPFIIGTHNSDITANAFQGNGGSISITTQGLFGLSFRDRLTPNNDITASSEFGLDGTVEINNPEVDPSSRILELPASFVDLSLLAQSGCALDAAQFVLTGRGGLPVNPQSLINSDRPWFDLRDPSAFLPNPSDTVASGPPAQSAILESPQEATGMAIASDGTLQLVAANIQTATIPHASCISSTNVL